MKMKKFINRKRQNRETTNRAIMSDIATMAYRLKSARYKVNIVKGGGTYVEFHPQVPFMQRHALLKLVHETPALIFTVKDECLYRHIGYWQKPVVKAMEWLDYSNHSVLEFGLEALAAIACIRPAGWTDEWYDEDGHLIESQYYGRALRSNAEAKALCKNVVKFLENFIALKHDGAS